MFRLWGKIWKDNRMEKDTVYEEESDDTRTHKIFRGWTKSAMNLTWAVRSGWKKMSVSSGGTVRCGFTRTVSLRRLSLIIWRYR